jgi:hypothetical protein
VSDDDASLGIEIWLRRVARLMELAEPPSDGTIMAQATGLLAEFPVTLFIDATAPAVAEALAAQSTVWPTYYGLRDALAAWLREHAPPAASAAPSTVVAGNVTEQAWAGYWEKHRGRTGEKLARSLIETYAPRLARQIATEVRADRTAEITDETVRVTALTFQGHPMRHVLIQTYVSLLARHRPDALPIFEDAMDSPVELARAYEAKLADPEAMILHAAIRPRLAVMRAALKPEPVAPVVPVAPPPPAPAAVPNATLIAMWRAIADDPERDQTARDYARSRLHALQPEETG